jgi:tripartite-type tricarboxylate transporter receptor subunit TctC
MFRLAAQVSTVHVPYKGLAPAVTDLLAGHVDFMIDNLGNSLAHVRNGRLKALGVASEVRIAELPDVETIAETYPAVISTSWFGIVAPPQTPLAIASRFSQAIAGALRQPEVVTRLRAMGFAPIGDSPEDFATHLKQEFTRWGIVVSKAGIKPE